MDIKNLVQPQQLQLLQPLQQLLLLPQQLLLLRLQLSPAFGNSGHRGIKELIVMPRKYQGGDHASVAIVQKILEVNVEVEVVLKRRKYLMYVSHANGSNGLHGDQE